MAPKYNLQELSKDHPFMTCLVKVNTRSSGQKTVAKVLQKCHGIYSFRMDDDGLVEISGTVDPNLLLKMVGKSGRKAELRWLQFGECSSNLFMPMNQGGVNNSYDGRYLHAGNLPRAKLPSHDALRSSAHNQKHDYQIAYDDKHDYDQDRRDWNYHYQHTYDHNQDYQHGCLDHKHHYQLAYDQKHHYPHSYRNYDHAHDSQYTSYGYRHDGNQMHYSKALPGVGGEGMGCCTVM
ncbi:uncharacterized protein LOC110013009 [Sesamum indicum]|uniref:Uncharacterized protein LOC110013009 n=1 Tax=Sesamum indicum TaxID=4182 RepID=A0A8M8VBV3_SESIN|nr:uncharacterized protein LOC110013009 [Sesamum indicum]